MLIHELILTVTDSASTRPAEVRAWVDTMTDLSLSGEQELLLVADGHGRWSAVFDVPQSGCTSFGYRIGLSAQEGAVWPLTIRG